MGTHGFQLAVVPSLAIAALTQAQSPLDSFYLHIDAPVVVTPSSGGASIEVWCGFTPDYQLVIQGGDFNVQASEPLFSSPRVVLRDFAPPPYVVFSNGVRTPEGDTVNDIVGGQRVVGGGGGGSVVDDSNPLLLWTVNWATRDFTPRAIEVAARPGEHFSWVQPDGGGLTFELPDPGFATIVVRTDCLADLDGNAELDVFDFIAFQNFFMDASPVADLDADGDLTLFDFLAFQNAFDAGC